MASRSNRNILPLLLFGLALAGGLAIWFITKKGESENVDDILAKAHSSLGSGVYELKLDLDDTETLIPNAIKDAAAQVVPRQELLVGPNACFHYQISMDGVFGEHDHSFQIGCNGDQTWSFLTGDDEVKLHASLDSESTTDPLSPLALRALKRALEGWRDTRSALNAGTAADEQHEFELVDKVSRTAGAEELYWRLETKRARGGQRLRLWVNEAGDLKRFDCGSLSFLVIKRKDLTTADFEITRWVPEGASSEEQR